MKKLKIKESFDHFPYQNDVDRIVKIFADAGYDISHSDAARAWEKYSDSMAAGWMSLDGEDCYVFDNCSHYFEEVE
jgi:hypothetical protein